MYGDIFLLSVEDAEKIPRNLRTANSGWWLSTPLKSRTVAYMGADGLAVPQGQSIDKLGGVRPAIRFQSDRQIEELPFTDNGYVLFLGRRWIDISDFVNYPCILKAKPFKNPRKFSQSEIKKALDKWFSNGMCFEIMRNPHIYA